MATNKNSGRTSQFGNPNALINKYNVSATTGRAMEEIRDNKPWKKNQDDQGDLWNEN